LVNAASQVQKAYKGRRDKVVEAVHWAIPYAEWWYDHKTQGVVTTDEGTSRMRA